MLYFYYLRLLGRFLDRTLESGCRKRFLIFADTGGIRTSLKQAGLKSAHCFQELIQTVQRYFDSHGADILLQTKQMPVNLWWAAVILIRVTGLLASFPLALRIHLKSIAVGGTLLSNDMFVPSKGLSGFNWAPKALIHSHWWYAPLNSGGIPPHRPDDPNSHIRWERQ